MSLCPRRGTGVVPLEYSGFQGILGWLFFAEELTLPTQREPIIIAAYPAGNTWYVRIEQV